VITLRKSEDRGHFNHGWLETFHTFSFGDYDNPAHRGFRTLRVINEDFVEPGQGFPPHSHRDMEIITYLLEGSLAHKDSLGTGSVIRPGEIQRMSAGSGITHSEFNASQKEPVHLLQIWIRPGPKGIPPSYEQQQFSQDALQDKWLLLASAENGMGLVKIHQDARLFAARISAGTELTFQFEKEYGWLQVARGALRLREFSLEAGDGLSFESEKSFRLKAAEDSEVLLFELD
jgi:quercetin 2,3-dioxygenase